MSDGPSYEARILMAIDAIHSGREQSIGSASTTFTVKKSTLANRMKGIPSRNDCRPNSTILSIFEERVLCKYLLDRDDRGFGLSLAGVEDMANLLLGSRNASPVGVNWAQRFIERKPELKVRYSRGYDFQRT